MRKKYSLVYSLCCIFKLIKVTKAGQRSHTQTSIYALIRIKHIQLKFSMVLCENFSSFSEPAHLYFCRLSPLRPGCFDGRGCAAALPLKGAPTASCRRYFHYRLPNNSGAKRKPGEPSPTSYQILQAMDYWVGSSPPTFS